MFWPCVAVFIATIQNSATVAEGQAQIRCKQRGARWWHGHDCVPVNVFIESSGRLGLTGEP